MVVPYGRLEYSEAFERALARFEAKTHAES